MISYPNNVIMLCFHVNKFDSLAKVLFCTMAKDMFAIQNLLFCSVALYKICGCNLAISHNCNSPIQSQGGKLSLGLRLPVDVSARNSYTASTLTSFLNACMHEYLGDCYLMSVPEIATQPIVCR